MANARGATMSEGGLYRPFEEGGEQILQDPEKLIEKFKDRSF